MAIDRKSSVMKSCANGEYSKDCVNIDLEPWSIMIVPGNSLLCVCFVFVDKTGFHVTQI